MPSAAMKQLAAFTLVLIAGAAQAQIGDPIHDQNTTSAQSVYNQHSASPRIHNENTSSAAKTHYINSGGSEQFFNDNYQGDHNNGAGRAANGMDQSYPQAGGAVECYGCAEIRN